MRIKVIVIVTDYEENISEIQNICLKHPSFNRNVCFHYFGTCEFIMMTLESKNSSNVVVINYING